MQDVFREKYSPLSDEQKEQMKLIKEMGRGIII